MDDDSEDYFSPFSWKINLTNRISVNERLKTNVESKKDAKEKAVVRSTNKTVRERLAEIRVAERLKTNVESKKDAEEKAVVSTNKTAGERLAENRAKKGKKLKSPVLSAEKSQTSVFKNNEAQGKAAVSKNKKFADELRQPTKISVCRKLFDEINSPSRATVSVKPPMKLNNNFEENFTREPSLKTSTPFQNKFKNVPVANKLLKESNITDFEKNEQLNVDELVDFDWNISLFRRSSKKVPVVNNKEQVIKQILIEAEDQKNSENENIEVLSNLITDEKPKKRNPKKTQDLSKGLEKNTRIETESKTLNTGSPNGRKMLENVIVGSEISNDDKTLNNSRNLSEKETGKNCIHSNINAIPFEIPVLDLHLPVNFEPEENEIGDGLASSGSSTVSSRIIRRSLRINKEENYEGKYFPKKVRKTKDEKKTNNLKEVNSELLTKTFEHCKSSKKKNLSKSSKEKECEVEDVERIAVNFETSPDRNRNSIESRTELEQGPAKKTETLSPQKLEAQFIDKEESANTEKRPVRKRNSTVLTTKLEQEPTVPGKKPENSSPHKVETRFIVKEEENVNANKQCGKRKRKSTAKFDQKSAVPAKETENPSLHKPEDQFVDEEEIINVNLGKSIPSKRLKSVENANEQIIVYDSNLREDVALNCVQRQEFYTFDVARNETASVAKILRHEKFATGIMKLNPKEEKGFRFTLGDTLAFWISRGTLEVTIHETKIKLFENDSFYVPAENGYNIVNLSDYEAILVFFQLKSYTAA